MIRYDITRFVGSWASSSGYRMKIKMQHKVQATVDFLDPSGSPVCRPYMNGAPSLEMVAHYDDYNGSFEVDLWEAGRGFVLDLTHEYDYELDEMRREALVPAIVSYEDDHFLDEYYSLFGPLDHFVRTKFQNHPVKRTEASHSAGKTNRKPSSAGFPRTLGPWKVYTLAEGCRTRWAAEQGARAGPAQPYPWISSCAGPCLRRPSSLLGARAAQLGRSAAGID